MGKEVDLEAVARECAPTFTGADLYALCADAWMAALKRAMATVGSRVSWPALLCYRGNKCC